MTPQLYALKSSLVNVFSKHHPFIVIAITLLLLSAAIYSLYGVVISSSIAVVPNNTAINIDKKTVEQIKNLRVSSEGADTLAFPTPRPNPFQEK